MSEFIIVHISATRHRAFTIRAFDANYYYYYSLRGGHYSRTYHAVIPPAMHPPCILYIYVNSRGALTDDQTVEDYYDERKEEEYCRLGLL